VLTGDPALAQKVRSLRNYGQGRRYYHLEPGQNSRLDELQAALLRVKLAHLDEHNAIRRGLARAYADRLAGVAGVTAPVSRPGAEHVFHLYVVRHSQRDPLMEALAEREVQTLIHYPVPVHRQPAYGHLGYAPGSLPVTERLTREILSLPLYVGLDDRGVDQVSAALGACVRSLDTAPLRA
jgi:dTDP-4-amino-4,6-dideoxygalactose transaminase